MRQIIAPVLAFSVYIVYRRWTMKCRNSLEPDSTDLQTARLFAALAHPARLCIIRQLACQDTSSCCKDIVAGLDLAQSTVSQHLKILVDAGLVDFRQSGQSSRYSICPGAFARLATLVGAMADLCCQSDGILYSSSSPQRENILEDR
ncbi:MAG: ArsR/SmtB family transcription factor [Phyllobacterium sp.]